MKKSSTITQNQSTSKVTAQEDIDISEKENTTPKTAFIHRLNALFWALRPRQWTKNGAIFIGLIFSSQLTNPTSILRTILAFIVFCLASSSIYLLNDLLDLEKDRQHPVKRKRPLASGQLPIPWAIVGIIVLLILCISLTSFVVLTPPSVVSDAYSGLLNSNLLFTLTIVSYILLMVLYTLRLKHIVLIDVFIIAAGFVLRIIAGAVVIPVVISPWLYLVTCFLSLFLALSKRRHEITLLQDQASSHRQILKEYRLPLLDQMITIVVTCTLVSYSLYTIEGPTGNHRLMITIPFVLYGLFRYLYLVYVRMEGGSPEEILLRDRHMLGTVLLCAFVVISVLYFWP